MFHCGNSLFRMIGIVCFFTHLLLLWFFTTLFLILPAKYVLHINKADWLIYTSVLVSSEQSSAVYFSSSSVASKGRLGASGINFYCKFEFICGRTLPFPFVHSSGYCFLAQPCFKPLHNFLSAVSPGSLRNLKPGLLFNCTLSSSPN